MKKISILLLIFAFLGVGFLTFTSMKPEKDKKNDFVTKIKKADPELAKKIETLNKNLGKVNETKEASEGVSPSSAAAVEEITAYILYPTPIGDGIIWHGLLSRDAFNEYGAEYGMIEQTNEPFTLNDTYYWRKGLDGVWVLDEYQWFIAYM